VNAHRTRRDHAFDGAVDLELAAIVQLADSPDDHVFTDDKQALVSIRRIAHDAVPLPQPDKVGPTSDSVVAG
jgi:hypothetical protein